MRKAYTLFTLVVLAVALVGLLAFDRTQARAQEVPDIPLEGLGGIIAAITNDIANLEAADIAVTNGGWGAVEQFTFTYTNAAGDWITAKMYITNGLIYAITTNDQAVVD
jgi:hypothetical protein